MLPPGEIGTENAPPRSLSLLLTGDASEKEEQAEARIDVSPKPFSGDLLLSKFQRPPCRSPVSRLDLYGLTPSPHLACVVIVVVRRTVSVRTSIFHRHLLKLRDVGLPARSFGTWCPAASTPASPSSSATEASSLPLCRLPAHAPAMSTTAVCDLPVTPQQHQ